MKNAASKKLLIFAILYCALRIAGFVVFGMEGGFTLSGIAQSILVSVVCFLMFYSYEKHTKNMMKPLLGAALMLILYYEIDATFYYVENVSLYAEEYPNGGILILFIGCAVASFAFMVLLNVMHYVINLTHHSSPGKIGANKAFFVLYVVFLAGQSLASFFLGGASLLEPIRISCIVMARIFPIWSVITIEGSLDEFRLARETQK